MNEFDHRPDPEIGSLLRGHLDAPDDAAFLTRFRSRLAAEFVAENPWEVLSRWSRVGIAALLLLALGLGSWLGQTDVFATGSATLADAVVPAEVPSALLTPSQPTRDVMLAAVLEGAGSR